MVVVESQTFHWADYLVFGCSLFFSMMIGVFFAITGRKKSSLSEMLMAEGQLMLFPGALSMIATFLSAILILGMSAEVHYNGAILLYTAVAMVLTGPAIAVLFTPIFYRLKSFSCYQYLEHRFHVSVRVLGCFSFVLQMMAMNAVVLYAPSIAFEKVLDIPWWVCIIACSVVCTFYTVIGGMKAVVWTDTFQMLVVISGVITLVVKGLHEAGGFNKVIDNAEDTKRLDFNEFSFDPRVRHTFWGLAIANIFNLLGMMGTNQANVQRTNAMKSINKARCSNVIAGTLILAVFVPIVLLGLTMYTYYKDCDPIISGAIKTPDQIVPLFMMDTIGHLHGLPGLFAASVFSASLSTVSSSINSLVAVFLEDIVEPMRKEMNLKKMKERTALTIAKILGVIIGLASMGLAFVVKAMGTRVFQMSMTVINITGAPLLALFSMGIFMPFINTAGAISGYVVSFSMVLWVSYKSIDIGNMPEPLEIGVQGCFPMSGNMSGPPGGGPPPGGPPPGGPPPGGDAMMEAEPAIYDLYRMSYLHYTLFTLVIAFVVGTVVSLITRLCCKQGKIERSYLFNFGDCKLCLKNEDRILEWGADSSVDKKQGFDNNRF